MPQLLLGLRVPHLHALELVSSLLEQWLLGVGGLVLRSWYVVGWYGYLANRLLQLRHVKLLNMLVYGLGDEFGVVLLSFIELGLVTAESMQLFYLLLRLNSFWLFF